MKKREQKRDLIRRRKFELFKRDPLAQEFDKLFRKSLRGALAPAEEDRSIELEKILPKKWACSLIPSRQNPSPEPFAWFEFHSGHNSIRDMREYIREDLLPYIKNLSQDPHFKKHNERYGWIFAGGIGGLDYEGTAYIPVPKGSIPILIDVGGITEKPKEDIAGQFWKIIKDEIRKRKQPRQKTPSPQIGDPQELAFLYNIKDDKFRQYLKWYDCHFIEKLTFREIALREFSEKKFPGRDINKLKGEAIGFRVGSDRAIGKISEETVEHGVKLIHHAVHRKPYPSKPRQHLPPFWCDIHQKNPCPKDCTNLKKWDADTKKRLRRPRKIYTSDVEHLPDPKEQAPPAKGKGASIREKTKYQ